MIKAEVIKDSVSPTGKRITTFVLVYPRFIHSEFMTHRALSRNASSSRAIPVAKFMEAITKDPAMPISFSKNCKGMQAEADIENQEMAKQLWLEARDSMMNYVSALSHLGVHKQHANRLLEPFQHITVVTTATEWANFFALRTHKDAQPEFRELATCMWNAYSNTEEPTSLLENEWHLPFINNEEYSQLRLKKFFDHPDYESQLHNLIKQSVARCARVSYNTHDGTENSLEKDIELYNRLVGSAPIHASPTEHQAMALSDPDETSGNFIGWKQYRKILANENILKFPELPKT
jgi:thymidylate synthase ThyX